MIGFRSAAWLAATHGWAWWGRTEFEGPAAAQRAILLARTLVVGLAHRDGADAV